PIIDKIAALEEKTFKDRKVEEERRERRDARNNARNRNGTNLDEAAQQMAVVAAANARKVREDAEVAQKKADAKNFAAASELKARLAARNQSVKTPSPVPFAGGEEEEEEDEVVASGFTAVATTGTKRAHENGDGSTANDDEQNDAIDADNKSQDS
ncbi:hypothetical protein EV175_007546, partial [Coemansia sp. RSA 1933]